MKKILIAMMAAIIAVLVIVETANASEDTSDNGEPQQEVNWSIYV